MTDRQKILQLRNTEASAFLMGNFTIMNADVENSFKYHPLTLLQKPINDQISFSA